MSILRLFSPRQAPPSSLRSDSSVRRLQAQPRRSFEGRHAALQPARRAAPRVNAEVTLKLENLPEEIAEIDDLDDQRALSTVYNILRDLQKGETPQPTLEFHKHDTFYVLVGIGYKDQITLDDFRRIDRYNSRLRAAPIMEVAVHCDERGLFVKVKIVKQSQLSIALIDHPNGLTSPPQDESGIDAHDYPLMITKKRRIEALQDSDDE